MENVSQERFAESVKTAIGTVTYFYGQIDRLNSMLKETLTGGDNDFSMLCEIPPQPEKRKRTARVIRYDYGCLFAADTSGIDEDIDIVDDVNDDNEPEGDGEEPKKKSKRVEIRVDQPLLVVHTILYSRKRPDDVEPKVFYAALGKWCCGTRSTKPATDQPFRLRRYMSWRVIRAINHRTNASVGDRISTRAIVTGRGRGGRKNPELELSGRLLAPIESVALYELDGSGAIEKLAARIKAYWQKYVVSVQGE